MNDTDELPFDKLRKPSEVAIRCVVLLGVVAAGHQQPRSEIVHWLRQYCLWDAVTPNEAAFLLSESPSQHQTVDATWRAEALYTLLWALHRLPTFISPTQQCNLQQTTAAMPELYSDPSEFIASARLRDPQSIYDVLDPIFHVHWEVRDAEIRGKPVPNGYDSGAVVERHYAYNWLTCWQDQEWDDVTTDT